MAYIAHSGKCRGHKVRRTLSVRPSREWHRLERAVDRHRVVKVNGLMRFKLLLIVGLLFCVWLQFFATNNWFDEALGHNFRTTQHQ
jgi:hypothetical protein